MINSIFIKVKRSFATPKRVAKLLYVNLPGERYF
jgi:hypothetical protein